MDKLNWTASEVADILSKDLTWLNNHQNCKEILDNIEFDSEISSLNISINLKDLGENLLALDILSKIRTKYPQGAIGFYESAINYARLLKFDVAIEFAKKSVALQGINIEFKIFLCKLYAVTHQFDKAKDTLRQIDVVVDEHRRVVAELAQFISYSELWSMNKARQMLSSMQDSGAYIEAKAVSDLIMAAIQDKRPFSFVRLGDGEGAWLQIDNFDEGQFSSLYRANRISFLNDWFGSANLIDDDNFHRFCKNLGNSLIVHDMLGIPPLARIDQEEGFLSTRGIPSSVNVFRFLAHQTRSPKQVFCSNSINLGLLDESNFYNELFSVDRKFSMISSHANIADMMNSRGLKVGNFHVVPGDSRNFHIDNTSRPICQFPDYLDKIDADLKNENLSETIYLVAAGFVGKQYIKTIRERGGIALDIGSLADHWGRHGLS